MSGPNDRRLDRLATIWPSPPPAWALRAARRILAGAEPIFQRLYAEKLAREEPTPPDMSRLTDADLEAIAAELAPVLNYPAVEVLTDLREMREDAR